MYDGAFPSVLYNSSFLHQTTTLDSNMFMCCGCIILLFYIKPQPDFHRERFLTVV